MIDQAAIEYLPIRKAIADKPTVLPSSSYREVLSKGLPPEIADKLLDRASEIEEMMLKSVPSEFRQSKDKMRLYSAGASVALGMSLTALTAASIELGLTPIQFGAVVYATTVAPAIEELINRGFHTDIAREIVETVTTRGGIYTRQFMNLFFAGGHTNPESARSLFPTNSVLSAPINVVSKYILGPSVSFLWSSYLTKLASEDGLKRSFLAHSMWNSLFAGTIFMHEIVSKNYPAYANIATTASIAAGSLLSIAAMTEGVKEIKDDLLIHKYVESLQVVDSLSEVEQHISAIRTKAQKLLSTRRTHGYKFAKGVLLSRLLSELEVVEFTQPGEFRSKESERIFQRKIIAAIPEGLNESEIQQRIDYAVKLAGYRKEKEPQFKSGILISRYLSIVEKADSLKDLTKEHINPELAKSYIMNILKINPYKREGLLDLRLANPFMSGKLLQETAMRLYKRLLELEVKEFSDSQPFQHDWVRDKYYEFIEKTIPSGITVNQMGERILKAKEIMGDVPRK